MKKKGDRIKILLYHKNNIICKAVLEFLKKQCPEFKFFASNEISQTLDIDIILTESNSLNNLNKDNKFCKILKKYPKAGIILLDNGLNKNQILKLMNDYNNLKGIFQYNTDIELFKKGIVSVAKGDIWFSREFLRYLFEQNYIDRESFPKPPTKREKEIIELICEGLSNKEIAYQLNISENTVKTTISRIFKKYNIKSRAELIKIFLKRNN